MCMHIPCFTYKLMYAFNDQLVQSLPQDCNVNVKDYSQHSSYLLTAWLIYSKLLTAWFIYFVNMPQLSPLHFTDVNECDTGVATCHINATCTNSEGSYDCECMQGFIGDGFNCSSNLLHFIYNQCIVPPFWSSS